MLAHAHAPCWEARLAVTLERRTIGTTAGHARQPAMPVDEFRMIIDHRISAAVWTLGASLIELNAPDRAGGSGNVVVRLPQLADYERRDSNPCHLGATLGRFARCVSHARFPLNGQQIELTPTHGPHHFHGGTYGFDRYVWNVEDYGRDGDDVVVRLSLERPDGDEGYPGAVRATATYRLGPDACFTIDYSCTTSARTIVALASHAFWNLAGAGSIDGHELTINAARVLTVDADLVPIGLPVPVAGSALDYRQPRTIGRAQLDHCYVLDDTSWCLELASAATGRRLRVSTTAPGLQVYTGEALPSPRAGICFQTGAWPDAPNHPDYPSVELNPGETYRQQTTQTLTIER